MARIQTVQIKDSTTLLGAKFSQGVVYPGGLDLMTPPLLLHPGACRDIVNFEVAQNGGYSRIGGYERYSGLPSPSDASFVIVQVSTYVNVPSVGDEITQAVSGATGVVALVSNAPDAYYMVVTKTVGTFNTTNIVSIEHNSYTVTQASGPLVVTSANSPFVVPLAATEIGTAITTSIQLTAALNAQYLAAAADIYREDIEAVPGSGPILGVVHMIFDQEDEVYAFRANVAETAVNIYKASNAGWVLVPLFNTISFTGGGTTTPLDGETLTQGLATATIKRVMTQNGQWSGSAAGVFVITTPSMGFAAGAATTSGGATVMLSGASAPIVIQPEGAYEFVKCNFYGQLSTRRIYGSDGVNKCFEFDGETYAPITTGLSPDAPSHITYYKGYLFVSFASSVFYCGAGTPYMWSSINGGGEIACGDTVTNMLPLPGSQNTAALGIWMTSSTNVLYGVNPTTFNLTNYNTGTGAIAQTAQNLADAYVFGEPGIFSLQTTLNFGNFLANALTKNIQPFINQQRSKITTSSVQRSKGQYRVFFNDGYGLYLTFANQSYLGAAIVQFDNPVNCIDDDTNTSGSEVTYFGSTDDEGYVYQLDVGPSFDGENLFAYFIPAWDYFKTPRWLKRYRRASIEMQGNAYAAVSFNYGLGDNNPLIGQPIANTYTSSFSPAQWDNATWDDFYWDGQTTIPTYATMDGTANDVQPVFGSTTNYIQPFTVSSIIYDYSLRRRMRAM